MLSRRAANILFVVLMALVMSLVMSFAITLMNTRLDAGFTNRWMRAFLLGWLIATPTALLAFPLIGRMVDAMTAR